VNVATVSGVTVGALAGVAGFIMLFGRRSAPMAVGSVFRCLALALTLVISVVIFAAAIDDTDLGFMTFLVSVPLVTAAVPLVFDVTGRATAGVTAVCAALMLACGVVLALGIGLYYLAPALLLGIAAVASVQAGTVRTEPPRALVR
jgi:hypothetical protein